MSVRLMTAAWSLKLHSTDKLVLLALADWSNDHGTCWPSMIQLADKSGLTDRAVRACIGRLCADGHLTRSEVPGKGVNYRVHPTATPEPRSALPRNDVPPEAASPRNETTETPEPRSANTSVTTKGSLSASPPKKASARKAKFDLPSDIPADEWRDYEDMRRLIRKPMSDGIREKAITRLRKLRDEDGWPPGEVLSHSTLNNYQGLFPPKDDRNGNRTQRRMDGQPDLRGSRPDPSLDLLRTARRAEEAERSASSGQDHWGAGPPLQAIGFH